MSKESEELLLVQFENMRRSLGDLWISWDILGDFGASWDNDLGDSLGEDNVLGENGENLWEHFREGEGEGDLEKVLWDIRGDARGDLFPSPTLPVFGESGGVSNHSSLCSESGDLGKPGVLSFVGLIGYIMGLNGEEGLLKHGDTPVKR